VPTGFIPAGHKIIIIIIIIIILINDEVTRLTPSSLVDTKTLGSVDDINDHILS